MRSLETSDRRTALLLARALSVKLGWLFIDIRDAMAQGKDPSDIDWSALGIDPERIIEWKAKLPGGFEIEAKPGNKKDHKHALEVLREVLATQPVQPPLPASAVSSSRVLSELMKALLAEKGSFWAPATRIEYESALDQFIGIVGDRPAGEVTSRDIASYTDHLRNTKQVKQRTIDKKLGPIAALFKLAQRDGDFPAGDLPTKGHFLFVKSKGRRAERSGYAFLNNDDLAKIFAPANLLVCKKPHEFWLPLLGIFTGARLNELCQLDVADIHNNKEGTWVINFVDSNEKKRLKTEASIRTIPLHPSLIDAGFLDYLDDLRGIGAQRIFPYLRYTEKSGFGDVAGEAYARYIKRIKLEGSGKVYHSLRKTANDTLAKKSVQEEHRCAWMGHDHATINSRIYSTQPTPELLLKEVARHLVFPEIDVHALRYQKNRFLEVLRREMARRRRLEGNRNARSGSGEEA
ncbi:MAG: phage integrase N-terminal SAM-like domain-containing protein [Rhodocyclaceae bacterium]|nr:phage integrase N-terminal SAM-like domain-containing protein [Rhodocyclaceae bacterium]